MPHETEAQHLDGQLREALKDRAAAIKQAQEARAKADAWVAAAYEAAASKVGQLSMKVTVFWPPVDRYRTPEEYRDIIRALTPDDARSTLEAMLAEAEKRGEKQGMLRAAEIAWARVEGNSGRDREAAEISTAIRAEAEE